jgi:hypothetical protein
MGADRDGVLQHKPTVCTPECYERQSPAGAFVNDVPINSKQVNS